MERNYKLAVELLERPRKGPEVAARLHEQQLAGVLPVRLGPLLRGALGAVQASAEKRDGHDATVQPVSLATPTDPISSATSVLKGSSQPPSELTHRACEEPVRLLCAATLCCFFTPTLVGVHGCRA